MTKNEGIHFLRLIVKAKIALSEDRITETRRLLNEAELHLIDESKLNDQELIEGGVPVCICEDDRGWSTCGGECPYHPPKFICVCGGCGNCRLEGEDRACKRRVAYMRMCQKCDPNP